VAPTLVVVDVQRAFDEPGWAARNNPDAEARIGDLIAGWRFAAAPLVHVRHRSGDGGRFHPGTAGFEFKAEAEPRGDEPVLEKTTNSAFLGTGLEERLRSAGATAVVVAGLTTDHCCSATARMASDLGFETWVVSDATATHDRVGPDGEHYPAGVMHGTALASLSGEFAEIVTTGEALARLRAPFSPQSSAERGPACTPRG
jgi:nicotinamidase-related amidase